MYKFLYIEHGLEEKFSAVILERAAEKTLETTCHFTVVKDAFVGLECLQIRDYHVLLLHKNSRSLNASAVAKILQNLSIRIPIILLMDPINDSGYVDIVYHPVFVLPVPYNVKQLSEILQSALAFAPPRDIRVTSTPISWLSNMMGDELCIPGPSCEAYQSPDHYYDRTDNSSIADSYSEFSGKMFGDDIGDEIAAFFSQPIEEESDSFLMAWKDMLIDESITSTPLHQD